VDRKALDKPTSCRGRWRSIVNAEKNRVSTMVLTAAQHKLVAKVPRREARKAPRRFRQSLNLPASRHIGRRKATKAQPEASSGRRFYGQEGRPCRGGRKGVFLIISVPADLPIAHFFETIGMKHRRVERIMD
jgi:hypothetical protein